MGLARARSKRRLQKAVNASQSETAKLMETRANNALIGAFTLAIIAAAFGFVAWFSSGEKRGEHQTYRVVFTGSISGLSRGAWVLFNGVRVGEVTKIGLIPQDPAHVYALIDVDGSVPVRADTKSRLEYTGFTGVASVALTGGENASAPLAPGPDGFGVLMADRSDFQDLIETTRRVAGQTSDFLAKSNKLIDENGAALSASVQNVQRFTDALAANSDGVKDFLGAVADVGRTIKPLTVKLEALTSDTDAIIKAIDPAQVKATIASVNAMFAKLNATADKVDSTFTNLNGLLTTGDSKGLIGEMSEAARSFRRLADDLDNRSKEALANLTRFSNTGLRQYEALAADGRKTLDEITQAVRSIENNPTQFLFGKKTNVPEYTGTR
jgi:phospholipid/cholesterol/gamma-HCH transport system substrate-binding protein